MSKGFDITKPIYPQIIQYIKTLLANGEYGPGDKIPSVRDLALEFEVNPNTVQKALAELEREGLLRSERTLGRFVTEDTKMLSGLKADIVDNIVTEFVKNMRVHEMKPEDIIRKVTEHLRKEAE